MHEASKVMGFELSQCCGIGYEMEDVQAYHDIETAVKGKDIICTDSLSAEDTSSHKFKSKNVLGFIIYVNLCI